MDTRFYEQDVKGTWFPPCFSTNGNDTATDLFVSGIIASEAGEVLDIFLKLSKGQIAFEEVAERLKDELGDVLWGVTKLATAWGFSLEEIMDANINKLHIKYAKELGEKVANSS